MRRAAPVLTINSRLAIVFAFRPAPARPTPVPQQGVTAYMPARDIEYLETIEAMEVFYRKHGLTWRYGRADQIAKRCEVPGR
jgi:hypothetical protein